jgi:hypothetical protein
MAYLFDFDSVNRVLRVRFSGQVTDDDLLSFYRMAALMVEALDPLSAISDLSGVTSLQTTSEMIHMLANFPPALPQPCRTRVIVAPSDETYEMARMFELEGAATRPNLHVVRTVEEAWDIIGIRKPQFKPVQDEIESRSRGAASGS